MRGKTLTCRALFVSLGTAMGVGTASPAVAQSPITKAVQDGHYQSLWNPEGRLCFEREKRETLELEVAVNVCLKSLDTLAEKRGALRNPKPYELANFDYAESSLLTGLGAAYARRDRSDTTLTCAAMERLWVIAARLSATSKDAVSAEWYASYQRLPGSVLKVMVMCRSRNGAPEGAPPVPLS
jgi:hypothetical protein